MTDEETSASILNSIKKMLGIDPGYDAFDIDIQIHINSVFSMLHLIGASPPNGFVITGPNETWADFIEGRQHVEMIKTYIYLRVRLIFDPPATSFALDAFTKQADKIEWLLSTMELTFNEHAYDYQNVVTTDTDIDLGGLPYKFDADGNVWVEI